MRRFGGSSANLDSSHPKTMKALRAELDKVEKARGKDREDARKAKEVMDGVGMGGVVESSGGGEVSGVGVREGIGNDRS